VLKEVVTTAQQGVFLLPQLSAFLEQPLNGKGTGGEIGCAGILLVVMFQGVSPSFVLRLTMFGL
jgi:hypothetical protein